MLCPIPKRCQSLTDRTVQVPSNVMTAYHDSLFINICRAGIVIFILFRYTTSLRASYVADVFPSSSQQLPLADPPVSSIVISSYNPARNGSQTCPPYDLLITPYLPHRAQCASARASPRDHWQYRKHNHQLHPSSLVLPKALPEERVPRCKRPGKGSDVCRLRHYGGLPSYQHLPCYQR